MGSFKSVEWVIVLREKDFLDLGHLVKMAMERFNMFKKLFFLFFLHPFSFRKWFYFQG